MSNFCSTMMTEAPFSRAAIAATRPPAPPPMTTTSASRSQRIASAASAGCADTAPTTTAPAAAPEVRKSRRLNVCVLSNLALRGDLDTGVSSQNRWLQVRRASPGGQCRPRSGPAQVLMAQGQRADALASRHMDRVADRGGDQRHGLLADPGNPAVRLDVMDRD